MTSKKDIDYLKDILTSFNLIENYLIDISKYEFITNQEKQDAIINRLMIIGEATKQISKNLRLKYSTIPWKNMAGMSDILIHRYHGIDLEIVWEVIKVELPKYKNEINNIISQL
ncbi:MAG: DUF86 domain-containing protein [Halanaerobiales bacterium]|nr:DUF86 domain-containing protein [Halanaerobiales bacterium]